MPHFVDPVHDFFQRNFVNHVDIAVDYFDWTSLDEGSADLLMEVSALLLVPRLLDAQLGISKEDLRIKNPAVDLRSQFLKLFLFCVHLSLKLLSQLEISLNFSLALVRFILKGKFLELDSLRPDVRLVQVLHLGEPVEELLNLALHIEAVKHLVDWHVLHV